MQCAGMYSGDTTVAEDAWDSLPPCTGPAHNSGCMQVCIAPPLTRRVVHLLTIPSITQVVQSQSKDELLVVVDQRGRNQIYQLLNTLTDAAALYLYIDVVIGTPLVSQLRLRVDTWWFYDAWCTDG